MTKRKSIVALIITAVIIVVLAIMEFASFPLPSFIENGTLKYNSIASTIGLGIDLKGGYYVVVTPEAEEGEEADGDIFEKAVDVIQTRLDNRGYTEATITIQGSAGNREIRVEIPEVDDYDTVKQLIGYSGGLIFSGIENPNEADALLTGADIKKATAGIDNENGGYIVHLEFHSSGIEKFSQATKEYKDKPIYIYLGEELISSPTVNEQITSANAQITGLSSQEEAENIAAVINAGKTSLKFTVGEANNISATLGEKALSATLIAGAIGLLIVCLIMCLRYKGLGVISSIALVIYTILLVLLLALVPWVQLTLPGIAGIILSIGMAVDANVIIFERIREEYASGKTVTASIKTGFGRAFWTIFDSNLTTIIAAVILLILCPGTIKGFSITLLIGIILSMFTALVITRWLIKLFNPLIKDDKKPAFYNLKKGGQVDEI